MKARMKAALSLALALALLLPLTGQMAVVPASAATQDQIDALRALDYHLVLADDVSLHLCDETNVGRCVSFPLVHRTQIARHLPLMGLRGMDDLLETVSRYYDCLDG